MRFIVSWSRRGRNTVPTWIGACDTPSDMIPSSRPSPDACILVFSPSLQSNSSVRPLLSLDWSGGGTGEPRAALGISLVVWARGHGVGPVGIDSAGDTLAVMGIQRLPSLNWLGWAPLGTATDVDDRVRVAPPGPADPPHQLRPHHE